MQHGVGEAWMDCAWAGRGGGGARVLHGNMCLQVKTHKGPDHLFPAGYRSLCCPVLKPVASCQATPETRGSMTINFPQCILLTGCSCLLETLGGLRVGPSGCMLCLGVYGTVAGPALLGLGTVPAAPSPKR